MNNEPQNQSQDLFAQVVDATKVAIDGAADAYRDTFDDFKRSLPSFDEVVHQAMRMPGVEVNRASYLTNAIGPKHDAYTVGVAIDTTPAKAGITDKEIARMAKHSIGVEARRTTALSMAAGLPGGAAAAATIPADLIQFYAHLIRMIQKLSYLYGWRDLVHIMGEDTDMATARALVMFLGVMAGDEQADKLLGNLAARRRAGESIENLRYSLCEKWGSAKVESISLALGKRMAHRLTGQVAGKAVPVLGMVISGGISFAGFGDMAKRLHRQLKIHGA